MDLFKQLKPLAEQVEIAELSRESTLVEFEANKLKSSKVEETKGVAVRAVRNGRLGFAASSDLETLDRLAAVVLESASYGDEVPIQFPPALPAPTVKTYDPKIAELPIPRLVQMGYEILDLVLKTEPEARVTIQLQRGVDHTDIRNHAGAQAVYERSPLSIGVEVDRIQGDDVLILYESFGATTWSDDYLAFAKRLVDQLVKARTLTTIKSGKMPVLFSPSGSLVLGLPLTQGLDGKNVYTGISPLKGKTGEKLFDEKISVIDDATLDGRFASAPYDDEAVPHRRNVLVENGVLNGFIYDLKTAAMSGVESTGNGGRGLFNPPSPSGTNLILGAGETPLADMLAGIEEGILVEEVLGLGQGNIISGAFSNPLALAFKIEKGEIVGRVKDASIADNVYSVLKNVAAVSREQLWVYNELCMPYILIPEMNVIAKA
jgi:PmbA protein